MMVNTLVKDTERQRAFATINARTSDPCKALDHHEGFDMPEQPHRQAAILIVDDEDDIRRVVTDILEEEGYPVVSVRNGQEALDYLQTAAELPGLILLDLMMPVMDGPTFRSQQQRDLRLRNIPVVVFSAGRNKQQASTLDAAAFIAKPFDYDLLCDTVAVYSTSR